MRHAASAYSITSSARAAFLIAGSATAAAILVNLL